MAKSQPSRSDSSLLEHQTPTQRRPPPTTGDDVRRSRSRLVRPLPTTDDPVSPSDAGVAATGPARDRSPLPTEGVCTSSTILRHPGEMVKNSVTSQLFASFRSISPPSVLDIALILPRPRAPRPGCDAELGKFRISFLPRAAGGALPNSAPRG